MDRIRQSGGRGVPVHGIQDAMDDLSQKAVEVGIVTADGDGTHWEVFEGDVLVDVVLMPTEQPVTCRLGSAAGGPGRGVWMIPPAGTEVAVLMPGGDITGGGIIIATLSGSNAPADLAENQMVIVAPEVLVYDSVKGNAVPLATKADLDAVVSSLDGHGHLYIPGPGTGTVTTTSNPSVPSPTGTIVLKAE